MNITDISAAYDSLKLAQKQLNAVLESGCHPAVDERTVIALSHIIEAQDLLLSLRENWFRHHFSQALPCAGPENTGARDSAAGLVAEEAPR